MKRMKQTFSGIVGAATRSLVIGAIGVSTIFSASPAHAWDSDFHFNITYLIARDLGFSDEAAKLAAGHAEWTDESALSGPFLLSKARELNHFNGEKQQILDPAQAKGIVGFIQGKISVSQPDNPIPDAFFMRALIANDLDSALMHVHTGQDKQPHSKFYSRLGHPTEGHWPDRYWLTPETQTKFEESVKQTYRMLYAVRRLLPPEALDLKGAMQFGTGQKPEDLDNPALLAKRFIADAAVSRNYHTDFLKNPEYVKNAVALFFDGLKERGVVSKDLDYANLLPKGVAIDGNTSFWDIAVKTIAQGEFMKDRSGKEIFHMDTLMGVTFKEFRTFAEAEKTYATRAASEIRAERETAGLDALSNAELVTAAKSRANIAIANRIMNYLAKGNVAESIGTGTNWVDMFEDLRMRTVEMQLRSRAWNDISKARFGHKVAFAPKLVRKTGPAAKLLSWIPGIKKDLVQSNHDHHDFQDPEIEMVSVTWNARMQWVMRQIGILTTSNNKIHSPEYLQGAYDYEDQARFGQMIAEGKIKTYSAADYNAYINGGEGFVGRMMSTLHDSLDKKTAAPQIGASSDSVGRLSAGQRCIDLFK